MVRIEAAASIAYLIEGLTDQAEQALGVRIVVNAAASGTLAQQISHGSQADLFISADVRWMDRLAEKGFIDESTRVDLARNRLVLVGPTGKSSNIRSLRDVEQPEYQPIAVGDPAYVPAGRYALQSLLAHGLEPGPDLRLAEAPDARAAAAYVISGQCPVGLIYGSDAVGASGVEVLLTLDQADHDPILYPAAILRETPHRDEAVRVLNWLQGEQVQAVLRGAGFAPG